MTTASNNVRKPRVLISYARSDGGDFARDLRTKLEKENIPLWQDRSGMEGGRDWWLQITKAIDQVEFMVLVMTPAAMVSPVVRKEWRYARQKGVCVYPVKAAPNLDFASLPRWMAGAHFYDLEQEGPKFINDLNTRCEQPRVPFMVEDLPGDFVPREQELNSLIGHLLSANREEPVAITAALRGAGGYGKTTLAKAICHNEDIQNAFDDGILWVTLGENPSDLTGKVADLVKTLSDEPITFSGLEATAARLRELLADRDILLVIDDVWDQAHVRPFLQGGKRCARLVTTRNLDTLPGDAKKVQVDEMSEDEALTLLRAGLPADQADAQGRALAAFAARLGEWPQLIKLANGMLRKRVNDTKQPLPDALMLLNKALDKRGLTAFDAANASDRNQAVGKTLGLSIDMLAELDPARFAELAVFDEDVDIPLATLEKYWGKTGGLDELESDELCQRLFGASLLHTLDLSARNIRLHDTVRHYLIGEHLAALPQWHGELLAAYNPQGKAWADVADDGYLYLFLAHHLIGARRQAELAASCKDMRYLPAKTFSYKSWVAEQDLRHAQAAAPEDVELRELAKGFAQAGHVLNRATRKQDLVATLVSRLARRVPDTVRRAECVPPFFAATHPLPDLPHPALVRTLSGHTISCCCAVYPDGQCIVSASWYMLTVSDAASGTEKFDLRGHTDMVTGCAVSPDGKWIVSASDDATLKVWDAASGAERMTLAGHTNWVKGCAVSPDGRWIVSASWDKTLKVWDVVSGAERMTLTGHLEGVSGCAVSADGQWILSASADDTLKAWNATTGAETFTLAGHAGGVTGCAVSPDSQWFVSASMDKTLKVWDVASGAEQSTLAGHTDGVTGCAVSPDGRWILSASWDKTLKVWDAASGAERMTLTGHLEGVSDCAISADGKWIVSASNDKTLKVWDAASELQHVTFVGHTEEVYGCAVSPDGQWIVSASQDLTLKVWNAMTGAEKFTLAGHTGGVTGCAVSPDGHRIVSASSDKTLKVWDAVSGAEKMTLAGHTGKVIGCAVSADGQWILSGSQDGTLKGWDAASGKEKFTLMSGHAHVMSGCTVSPDGKWIVSVSRAGALKVWDAASGAEELTVAAVHRRHAVLGCVVSTDSQSFATVSDDETVKILDIASGMEKLTLAGHTDTVTGCAFSPDGQWIVSVSKDSTVRAWNAKTGACVATLYVDGPLHCCAWHPDCEQIIAGGARGVYWLRLVR